MLRHFLAALLATATAFAASGTSQAAASIEIGYLPILPDAQLFVSLERKELLPPGAPAPKLVQFQSGPALVQALLAGQLDAAYVGIGPALVARAKGAPIKVVASNIVEQVSVLARGPLAAYFASGDPATAFSRFTKEHNRKPVLASYPRGAVPEAAMQYWLRERLELDPSSVDIIYQGEAQIQQSMLTGAIDGAAMLEPAVSIVRERDKDARVVAHGSELFPDQPGAVLVVRESLMQAQPKLVQHLVQAHIAATRLLRESPEQAAGYVQKYVGGGRLGKDLVETAIRNSHDQFQADPRTIIEATRALQAFQQRLDTVAAQSVDVSQLFDTRYFDTPAQP